MRTKIQVDEEEEFEREIMVPTIIREDREIKVPVPVMETKTVRVPRQRIVYEEEEVCFLTLTRIHSSCPCLHLELLHAC